MVWFWFIVFLLMYWFIGSLILGTVVLFFLELTENDRNNRVIPRQFSRSRRLGNVDL